MRQLLLAAFLVLTICLTAHAQLFPGAFPNDSTATPFRQTCLIISVWSDSDFVVGSGTIVGCHHVLTAAHVVYKKKSGGFAKSITVYPAADNGIYPFGTFESERCITGPNYSDVVSTPASDIAIIYTKQEIGYFVGGWLGLGGVDKTSRQDCNVLGYPKKLQTTQSLKKFRPVLNISGVARDSVFQYMIYFFNLNSGEGGSGGGVLNKNNEVMGILTQQVNTLGGFTFRGVNMNPNKNWVNILTTYDKGILCRQINNGELFREKNDGTVWTIIGGARLGVPSAAEFNAMGYSWSNIQLVDPGIMLRLPAVPRHGTLVRERSYPTVYFISDGKKYGIPNPTVLFKYGTWNDVRVVPNGSINHIPWGGLKY